MNKQVHVFWLGKKESLFRRSISKGELMRRCINRGINKSFNSHAYSVIKSINIYSNIVCTLYEKGTLRFG